MLGKVGVEEGLLAVSPVHGGPAPASSSFSPSSSCPPPAAARATSATDACSCSSCPLSPSLSTSLLAFSSSPPYSSGKLLDCQRLVFTYPSSCNWYYSCNGGKEEDKDKDKEEDEEEDEEDEERSLRGASVLSPQNRKRASVGASAPGSLC